VSELYRRSPHLVCYWHGRQLIFENYATHTQVAATPRTCEILHLFDQWRPAGVLVHYFRKFDVESIARVFADLVRTGLIERTRPGQNPADGLSTWEGWSPAASFFHFSTKDTHAPIEPEDSVRKLRQLARTNPPPSPVKRYPHARQVSLPRPKTAGELPRVLLARRTWRQFSRRPLELDKLATLLSLSFGVQSWLDIHGIGRVALKTSPSGGSRHPIEAYVMALSVNGLQRGLYHYDAAAHRLELLHRRATPARLARYLNGQWWFKDAAVLVLMTAVFARTQWKYPASRAYRVVLIDAGHVCQTFCLVATWLGLAPFCTMALADTTIENDLGIDGVTESILYTAGVGARPEGTDWAPWPSRAYGQRSPNPAL
jgi:SagB-type dehydrogenase family enzyme